MNRQIKKDETVKTETKKNTQKSKVKTGDNTNIAIFCAGACSISRMSGNCSDS